MTIEDRIYDLLATHRIERCSVSSATESHQWGRCTGCDFESQSLPIKGVRWDELAHDIARFHAAEVLAAELFPLVETLEDLDALPVGTVVRDSYPNAMAKLNDGWYCCAGGGARRTYNLPARVIDRPERNEP